MQRTHVTPRTTITLKRRRELDLLPVSVEALDLKSVLQRLLQIKSSIQSMGGSAGQEFNPLNEEWTLDVSALSNLIVPLHVMLPLIFGSTEIVFYEGGIPSPIDWESHRIRWSIGVTLGSPGVSRLIAGGVTFDEPIFVPPIHTNAECEAYLVLYARFIFFMRDTRADRPSSRPFLEQYRVAIQRYAHLVKNALIAYLCPTADPRAEADA